MPVASTKAWNAAAASDHHTPLPPRISGRSAFASSAIASEIAPGSPWVRGGGAHGLGYVIVDSSTVSPRTSPGMSRYTGPGLPVVAWRLLVAGAGRACSEVDDRGFGLDHRAAHDVEERVHSLRDERFGGNIGPGQCSHARASSETAAGASEDTRICLPCLARRAAGPAWQGCRSRVTLRA